MPTTNGADGSSSDGAIADSDTISSRNEGIRCGPPGRWIPGWKLSQDFVRNGGLHPGLFSPFPPGREAGSNPLDTPLDSPLDAPLDTPLDTPLDAPLETAATRQN
ncbi:MAG: hypothetical protein ABSF53_17725 [Terracidiphilus sp.]